MRFYVSAAAAAAVMLAQFTDESPYRIPAVPNPNVIGHGCNRFTMDNGHRYNGFTMDNGHGYNGFTMDNGHGYNGFTMDNGHDCNGFTMVIIKYEISDFNSSIWNLIKLVVK